MTPLFYFALVVLVAALPFLPAFREMRLVKDAVPLIVSRRSRVDIRHFANGLRDFLGARLGWALEDVRLSRVAAEGTADGVGAYIVVPDGSQLDVEGLHERIAVATGSLEIQGAGSLPREVYAQGDLAFAAAVELRAALAEGGMELADESTVLRWIHAGKHLVVGKGSRLFGRASSDDAIFLTAPTSFERLNAPTILAGRERTAELGHSETTTRIDPKDLAPHVEVHANRALVPGDVRIPADALVDVDVVALGDLHVGAKARVIGSLKAHGRILVQSGAWIEGGVVATEGVEVRAGAYVHGPLLSEESLIIGPDARIGDPDRPTTSRGRRVELHERARVHGTIWASKEGEVVPA